MPATTDALATAGRRSISAHARIGVDGQEALATLRLERARRSSAAV